MLRPIAALLLAWVGFLATRISGETSGFLMDVWTSNENLPDTSVTALAQTPDGYLWIGTMNGLARFDGVRFVHFDPMNTPALKHARVDRLFVDPRGTLWINTHDGSITALRDAVFTHEWRGGEVFSVFSQSNSTYLALNKGELVYRNESTGGVGRWEPIQLIAPATVNSFRQDAQGTLWFRTRNGTLGRVDGTNCQPVAGNIGLRGTFVTHLTVDKEGRLWVGTNKEIACWSGRSFEDQTPTNGEPDLNVTYLFCTSRNECWTVANGKVRRCQDRRWIADISDWRELTSANRFYLDDHLDSRGRVWIRSYGLGVFYADPDGTARRLTANDGLPNDQVTSWLEDPEGNIWLGVARGGLVRLREKQIQVIGAANGVQVPAIASVCEDQQGNIWFGTFGGGLYRWCDEELEMISPSDRANLRSFFSIYPDAQNRLWLSAGRENLHRLQDDRIIEMPDPAHGIKSLHVDRQERVWIGRQNGLACWTNDRLLDYSASGEFDRIDVRAIAEDAKERIWFGTGNGRLWQFEDGKFTMHQPDDNLKDQAIWSLLADPDGSLWVGTFRGGILQFRNGRFTRYTTHNGLPSNIISQLLDDGMGRLWAGSHKGIFYLPKAAFQYLDQRDIETLPCVSYGLHDGLPTLECTGNYQPACWQSQDGRLWFATVKGLVSIDPYESSVNRVPPPVVIEEVQLNGKPLSDRLTVTPAEAPLRIPPGRHHLDFRYTALSFTAPDKVRFRYRLNGFDNDWVEADTKRAAHYGPLPPGEYGFEVSACINDGVWNTRGATIILKVLPQFWQTWWFQGSAAIGILGAFFGAVRFTTTRRMRRKFELLKQQRAVERERERIAKDIHDDLGAGLTQILLQSSLARREAQGQISTDLTQISDTARELVGAMDEIVWAVDPENDTLDSLVTYLGKFVEEFVVSTGKRCRILLPARFPEHSVSAEARHNLYLAVKEALNNAAKHSDATEIAFRLEVQPSAFNFVVKDNGRGFDLAGTEVVGADPLRRLSGHGLRNMAQRLEVIGGACSISSVPGEGTMIKFSLPLHNGRTST